VVKEVYIMAWTDVEAARMGSNESGGGSGCIVSNASVVIEGFSVAFAASSRPLLIDTLARRQPAISSLSIHRAKLWGRLIDGHASRAPLHLVLHSLTAASISSSLCVCGASIIRDSCRLFDTSRLNYSFAHHAGSFRLSVAVITVVSSQTRSSA